MSEVEWVPARAGRALARQCSGVACYADFPTIHIVIPSVAVAEGKAQSRNPLQHLDSAHYRSELRANS